MVDTFTANYGFTKPELGASDDTWGDKLNADLDQIDALLRTIADGTSPGLPGSALVVIGLTPPSAPSVGSLWFDSVGGQMYIWYDDADSSQWVSVVNQAGA